MQDGLLVYGKLMFIGQSNVSGSVLVPEAEASSARASQSASIRPRSTSAGPVTESPTTRLRTACDYANSSIVGWLARPAPTEKFKKYTKWRNKIQNYTLF
jgi:hypothetical protein